jgi:hypothetical protein
LSPREADLIDYFKKFAPIPVEWADWVAHQLFEDNLKNKDDKNYDKLLIKKLEKIGLVNFKEWAEWYYREGI